MIKTSTLQLAMGQLAEARTTLASIAALRHMGPGAPLFVQLPAFPEDANAAGLGGLDAAPRTELCLSVEVVREALRTRLRTLADALAKAGLTFDEAGEELGKPPRSRAAKPLNGRRVKLPVAAPKPEAVA